jgi:hypothetical protein
MEAVTFLVLVIGDPAGAGVALAQQEELKAVPLIMRYGQTRECLIAAVLSSLRKDEIICREC